MYWGRIRCHFSAFFFCNSRAAALWLLSEYYRRLRSVYFIIIICQVFGAMLNNHLSISNII